MTEPNAVILSREGDRRTQGRLATLQRVRAILRYRRADYQFGA